MKATTLLAIFFVVALANIALAFALDAYWKIPATAICGAGTALSMVYSVSRWNSK